MNDQQDKFAQKIKKAEENLRYLKAKEAAYLKKQREKKKKEEERWYKTLAGGLDTFLKGELGADYMAQISQEELIDMIKEAMAVQRGREVSENENYSGDEISGQ